MPGREDSKKPQVQESQWSPSARFYERSASEIAEDLYKLSDSLAQANDRLNSHLKHSMDHLGTDRKKVLEHAKKLLRQLFEGNGGIEYF